MGHDGPQLWSGWKGRPASSQHLYKAGPASRIFFLPGTSVCLSQILATTWLPSSPSAHHPVFNPCPRCAWNTSQIWPHLVRAAAAPLWTAALASAESSLPPLLVLWPLLHTEPGDRSVPPPSQSPPWLPTAWMTSGLLDPATLPHLSQLLSTFLPHWEIQPWNCPHWPQKIAFILPQGLHTCCSLSQKHCSPQLSLSGHPFILPGCLFQEDCADVSDQVWGSLCWVWPLQQGIPCQFSALSGPWHTASVSYLFSE